ncbi:MAG: methyltransferase domain-containing protein [Bauldia sp.]|nr:methyltransferase domain-containing protein [Bauldia sp.]
MGTMTPLFDRALLVRRLRRAAARADGADFLLRRAADDLAERLSAVSRRFAVAADVGTPGEAVAELLAASGQVDTLLRLRPVAPLTGHALVVVADEELLPLGGASLDLLVSALALQWVNDLPGALAQFRRALRPDGLFLGAFVGGDSLPELRTAFAAAEAELRGGASPRVAPFVDLSEMGGLLQRAGFALPVADRDRLVVRYPSMLELIRDLRAMGATNALVERDRRPLTRGVLLRAAEIYAGRFADADGRVRATFEILSVSGWAPDASQQKPLRPGSAGARLADALGTSERSAGEKAGPR